VLASRAAWQLDGNNTEAFLHGLSIMGTGGGGSAAFGRAIMENDFQRGRKYSLVDPEDVPDDAFVVSGGIIGSVKVVDSASFANVVDRWENSFQLLTALRTMESFFGKKVDYVVPFELGGLNTPVMLSLGARANIPVINGDGLGRAAPETQMSSFFGHGISLTPMPLVDESGNIIIVKKTEGPLFPDRIGRWMVTNSGGMGANNHYPMDGKRLRASVIPKTITKALALGKAVFKARAEHRSPVETIAAFVNGYVFVRRGKIIRIHEENSVGFLQQIVTVDRCGQGSKKRLELVIKNEVMMCRETERNIAIFPDLVIIVDPDNGTGLMSTELQIGQEIGIILAPCHSRLKEALEHPQGKLAFGPARFGYKNSEYTPLDAPDPEQRNG
jgi:uncharacterized protein